MAETYGLPGNLSHVYGRRALVIARIAVVMARNPHAQRFIVYRTVNGGYLKVIPADERTWTGEMVGVYSRDVCVRELLDDLEAIDSEPAGQRASA
ncbi:MAG: hypothetical protein WCK28_00215 [Burkholderiales bacterium]|jgi:hypothetical protein